MPRNLLAFIMVILFGGGVSTADARELAERYTPDTPYRAINEFGVVLSAEPEAVVEVYAKPGASGPKYFCAAAEFSKRFLGASPSDRLVIVRPEGASATRSGAKSVLFGIVPRSASGSLPPTGLTINPRKAGEHRSVNSGLSFCEPPNKRRRDD